MVDLIATNELVKDFDVHRAVDRVSLTVKKGEVLGFLGPNGAGKSTTMKMITGYLTPTSGSAAIAGFDVVEHPIEAKRRLGYLPEGAPLYPDMTALGFLRFIASVRGFSGAEAREAVDRAIARTQIEDMLYKPIDTLSKGFKRRVGLAQALLHDPDVLILDEPTDGLDPNQKFEVRSLIRELAPQKAIVISTHILEEVDAVCTRAVIISYGRIVADGTPADLESRSRYHNAVSVTVPAVHGDALVAALAALESVAHVERRDLRDGNVRALAFPKGGTRIVSNIGQLVQAHGWPVSELKAEGGYLDDVFRSITQGDGAREGGHA